MSNDNYRTDFDINPIKDILTEGKGIYLLFFDQSFLHSYVSNGVYPSYSLDDFSEKNFQYDKTKWIPLCSDNDFLYLREKKSETGQSVMIWNMKNDEMVKEIDIVDDLYYENIGPRTGTIVEEQSIRARTVNRGTRNVPLKNSIQRTFVDEEFLFLGMTNGNIIVIEKKSWTPHIKLQPKENCSKFELIKLVSDKEYLYLGYNTYVKQPKMQNGYTKIFRKSNFEEIHRIELKHKVYYLYTDEVHLFVQMQNGEIEAYLKKDLTQNHILPIGNANAFNSDSKYLYFGVENKVKIHRKEDLSCFVSFEHGIDERLDYILSSKDFLILASSNRDIIRILPNIDNAIKVSIESRVLKLSNISKRTEFLMLDNLRTLLEFETTLTLLDWLYMLPINVPFLIKGEKIVFDIKQARKEELTEDVELLSESYGNWYKKGKYQKIENIMKKTEFLDATILSKLLDFADKFVLMNWIYTLPPEIPIIVKGYEVYFDIRSIQAQDIGNIIDLLIQQYSQFETQNVDKKE